MSGTARVLSVALSGVEGALVEVEVDVSDGLPGLTIVGLPDTALAEARDRVRAAVLNSGEVWPRRKVTVALSPAHLPKSGSAFDVPVALAVLLADEALPADPLRGVVVLGELGLDGRLRPVPGVLPAVVAARRHGVRRVVVPAGNAVEAASVPGIQVLPADDLPQLLAVLRGEEPAPPSPAADDAPGARPDAGGDLAEVVGQAEGRLALEVAAAGGHHLLLLGPPGCGKSMLAARLPGLLPDLDDAEALEVTAVHSVAGLLPSGAGLLRRPPFRAPHHLASAAAVVGGGSGLARPGAVSLAHAGVLLLDEAPEFGRAVLDALREPLESGEVVVARSRGTVRYPARPLLVLAANPCPCAAAEDACTCPPDVRRRYLRRLSGPLLDRLDLRVALGPVTRAELALAGGAEPSAAVAARVAAARGRARERLRPFGCRLNGQVPPAALQGPLAPDARGVDLLRRAYTAGALTLRGVDRTARVAWTLADLAGAERPRAEHVATALSLRAGTPAAVAA